MNATERQISRRGMGYGLRALGRLAASDTIDRMGLRGSLEQAIFKGTRGGFRSATRASRTFKAAQGLTRPVRPTAGRPSDLFDLNPDEEQRMFQQALRAFADERTVRRPPWPTAHAGRPRSCSPRSQSSGQARWASPRSWEGWCWSSRR